MAGGPNAAIIPCRHCAGPARRTHDGLETDWYECACGWKMGIDWEHGGPPKRPLWPITDRQRRAIEAIALMTDRDRRSIADLSDAERTELRGLYRIADGSEDEERAS